MLRPYSTLSISFLASSAFIFIVCLLVYSFVGSAKVLHIPDDNFDPHVLDIAGRLFRFPNGTFYFVEGTGEHTRVEISNENFPHIAEGQLRYDYGSSWGNWCWPRNFSSPFHSIVRAAQLSINVQLPLRLSVLLSASPRFVVVILLSSAWSPQPRAVVWLLGMLSLIETSLLFFVTGLHWWQDQTLWFLLRYSLEWLPFVVVARCMCSVWLDCHHFNRDATILFVRTLLRAASTWLLFNLVPAVRDNLASFVTHMWCDSFVSDRESSVELLVGLLFLCQSAMDCYDLRSFVPAMIPTAGDGVDILRFAIDGYCPAHPTPPITNTVIVDCLHRAIS